METKLEITQPEYRSVELGYGYDEMQNLISDPDTAGGGGGGSSFTALLELPAPQALELLVKEDFDSPPPIFSSNMKVELLVKEEALDSDSPVVSNTSLKCSKRKEREKKVKESNKKSKKVVNNEGSDGEKLPYVHVRARRGQATDSHSLAERARREKINARMKLLQELVPGCNKISGTAMVLDEIINHVQALQRQVEFLSMRLAAVDPRIDFNLDALLAGESGSSIDHSHLGMFPPSFWPEGQIDPSRPHQYQHVWHLDEAHQPGWGRDENASNFINTGNSLLSYNSPANSASMHSSQLKMEL